MTTHFMGQSSVVLDGVTRETHCLSARLAKVSLDKRPSPKNCRFRSGK